MCPLHCGVVSEPFSLSPIKKIKKNPTDVPLKENNTRKHAVKSWFTVQVYECISRKDGILMRWM